MPTPTDKPPAEAGPLHEMNPTGRFADRAKDYVKYRPTYPTAAIDAVLEGLDDPTRLTVADIGAGTGISSRLLADRGVRVIAVEPNGPMRESAEPHPRVEFRDGSAEKTGLPDRSVDLVVAAQAFHWFKAEEALAEFARILKPGGRLVIMWNARDNADPFTSGYIQAIRAVGGEHPAEMREFHPGITTAGGQFSDLRLFETPHEQRLDFDGLVGRATSASYVPKDGERLAELKRLFRALFDTYKDSAGMVSLKYTTRVYRGERRG